MEWLKQEIKNGLAALYVLSLNNTPSQELIAKTRDVWHMAIVRQSRDWQAELDVPRLRAGFETLCATAERWPAPAQLLAAMPPRKVLAITADGYSESKRLRNKVKLSEMLDQLGDALDPKKRQAARKAEQLARVNSALAVIDELVVGDGCCPSTGRPCPVWCNRGA